MQPLTRYPIYFFPDGEENDMKEYEISEGSDSSMSGQLSRNGAINGEFNTSSAVDLLSGLNSTSERSKSKPPSILYKIRNKRDTNENELDR